jgi:hypothetical protein
VTSRIARAAVAALALCCIGIRSDAQPAPYRHYRTLDTPHFHVHVAAGLEREGRVAGAAAERAYALLSRELVAPRGPIDLVVSDDADYSNGFATPLPTNRIVVLATPPVENRGLRLNEDWLQVVVTHELTHIFHLDRSRGIWAELQRVFGRAPYLFPDQYGPSWLTEGLAVYYESRLTEGGRLKDSEHRLLARAGALEHQLPRIGQLSLGNSRFPGGEVAYAYGSLFLDYLARTRGDSAIGRFVEAQSRQLIPIDLDRAAKAGFGVSFTRAFGAWRDSAQKSVGALQPPLPGWHELTGRSYAVPYPRWLNDSTVVYSGSDGREVNAAYAVTTGGRRERLGRRDGSGANVRLADGSLLYAQLEFAGPSEIRSDLYRSRGGQVTRLTHGARLIQPDARGDGTIAATQLAAARSSLVLLSGAGQMQRVLRAAGPDETWSEPRWSPDGTRIAAVHRAHGGEFSVVAIDVATDSAHLLSASRSVIESPSWTPDGQAILYTSEESGVPTLERVSAVGAPVVTTLATDQTGTGILDPELAPHGGSVAAVSLRADGYHVGVAPTASLARGDSGSTTTRPSAGAAPAAQPLATGDFHDYSPWRALLPRYWFPLLEDAPGDGLRLGASTSGQDVMGRHLYTAYAAVPTNGRFVVAGLAYRYAGMRQPMIDVNLVQDWTLNAGILGAEGELLGNLMKRTRDVSLAATTVRPRMRSYSSLTGGLGLERRMYATDPVSLISQLDTSFTRSYTFPRLFIGGVWSNVQSAPLSISAEDGVALAFTARERYQAGAAQATLSSSIVGTAAGYRSLDLPGFAHHVVAVRVAAGVADRKSNTALEVGGLSSTTVQILPGYTVGEGRRTFGVRGFPTASVYGTAALSGSVEYRAPLVTSSRGLGVLPFFFDHSSFAAFADGGVATCAGNPLYPSVCAPSERIGRSIASVGAEVGLSAAVLDWDTPQLIRIGIAIPVAGRELVDTPRVGPYIALGFSY